MATITSVREIQPPLTPPAGRGRGRDGRLARIVLIVAFSAPALILFSVFVVYPATQAVLMSLYHWSGFGPLTKFSGLDNFRRAVTDSVFRGAVLHTVFFIVATLVVQLPLALGLALLVRRRLWGSRVFRLIFFLPFVFSEVVAAEIWNFLYQPGFGGIDASLRSAGLREFDWLGGQNLVLLSIFIVATWKWVGFWMTLFITGLNQIPDEIEEAAMLDGASPVQILRFVTLPMLGTTIRLTSYLAVLGSLQTFELVFVMTGGGPAGASETLATYTYNYGFKSFQLGYGSAIAVILFVGSFAFSFIYQRFVFKRDLAVGGRA